MKYQLISKTKKEQSYASYKMGENNLIKVKFEFKIPINQANYLIPMLSSVELLDKDLKKIKRETLETVDIDWTDFNTTKIDVFGFIFFQTNFVVNGKIGNHEELEKYLKTCETIYSIDSGVDGLKVYNMFDYVEISKNEKEVFLKKYIIINR